jgi:hypothetical protein
MRQVLSIVAERMFGKEEGKEWLRKESKRYGPEEIQWIVLMTVNYWYLLGFMGDEDAEACYSMLDISPKEMRDVRGRSIFAYQDSGFLI